MTIENLRKRFVRWWYIDICNNPKAFILSRYGQENLKQIIRNARNISEKHPEQADIQQEFFVRPAERWLW